MSNIIVLSQYHNVPNHNMGHLNDKNYDNPSHLKVKINIQFIQLMTCLSHYLWYTLRRIVLPSTFWCFSLSQIEDSIQYLEGQNGIWKDHDRHIGVQSSTWMDQMVSGSTMTGILGSPETKNRGFQVLFS